MDYDPRGGGGCDVGGGCGGGGGGVGGRVHSSRSGVIILYLNAISL